MSDAAAIPVSSEICAFHCSTGSSSRKLQPPGVGLDVDLLLGQRQRDPAPRGLARHPQLADLAEQVEHRVGGAVGDLGLHPVVVELGAAAHQRPHDVDVGALTGLVDLDRPQQRGSDLVGQQRGRPFREHGRVQRDLGVGAVQASRRAGWPRRRPGPRDGRRRPRRRSRSARRSRRRRARCGVPGRGRVSVSGSIVTNGRSVRSRSGSDGLGGRLRGRGLDLRREVRADAELVLDGRDRLPRSAPPSACSTFTTRLGTAGSTPRDRKTRRQHRVTPC